MKPGAIGTVFGWHPASLTLWVKRDNGHFEGMLLGFDEIEHAPAGTPPGPAPKPMRRSLRAPKAH